MELEKLTREELKEIARTKGFSDIHNWSKAKLIKEINFIENSSPQVNELEMSILLDAAVEEEKPSTEVKLKKLSKQATYWKEYFEKIKITPEQFLIRFPRHKFKTYIDEIITFNQTTK